MIERYAGKTPAIAGGVGLSLSALYYRPKQPAKDWALKQRIEETLREHPAYGTGVSPLPCG